MMYLSVFINTFGACVYFHANFTFARVTGHIKKNKIFPENAGTRNVTF